jgi:hypothetical protein
MESGHPLSYCPRSSLPTNVLAWLASRLAHLAPSRPPGRGGTPPLALEVRLDAVAAVLLDGLSSRRAARMVGICKTEVGDSLDLGRAGPSFSAPTIAGVAALMLDKNPRSATDIPPASVTVTLSPTGPVTRYSNAGR